MTADNWHQIPKGDAWRQVHLRHVAGLGRRLWLRCGGCGHDRMAEPLGFGQEHGLDELTPLLAIARRLRCEACGARKAHCWPEPYGIKLR